jgi:acetyl esterase
VRRMTDRPDPAPETVDDVDRDVRRFQQLVSAAFARYPEFGTAPKPVARRIAEEVRRPWTLGGPTMRTTEELRVGSLGTRVRVHRPTAASSHAALLYVHGGGWMIFSLDTHDRLMREYASRAGVAVVGIDYSLSPEVKFPRALEECVDVARAVRRGEIAGIDVMRVAIGGDSAGANLSVATNLVLRDADEPTLDGMLLNYGAFDHRHTPSYERYDGAGYMLMADEMDDFWRNYTRSAADLDDPLVCPLRATLRDLPPAWLGIAECDILADQNRAMADGLRAAGVAVESHVYQGATHSFLESMLISSLAQRALEDAARWLRQLFAERGRDGFAV